MKNVAAAIGIFTENVIFETVLVYTNPNKNFKYILIIH